MTAAKSMMSGRFGINSATACAGEVRDGGDLGYAVAGEIQARGFKVKHDPNDRGKTTFHKLLV